MKKTINFPVYTVCLLAFVGLWLFEYVGTATMTVVAFLYVVIVNFVNPETQDEDGDEDDGDFDFTFEAEDDDEEDVHVKVIKFPMPTAIYSCAEEKELTNNPEYWKKQKEYFDIVKDQEPIVLDETQDLDSSMEKPE